MSDRNVAAGRATERDSRPLCHECSVLRALVADASKDHERRCLPCDGPNGCAYRDRLDAALATDAGRKALDAVRLAQRALAVALEIAVEVDGVVAEDPQQIRDALAALREAFGGES